MEETAIEDFIEEFMLLIAEISFEAEDSVTKTEESNEYFILLEGVVGLCGFVVLQAVREFREEIWEVEPVDIVYL